MRISHKEKQLVWTCEEMTEMTEAEMDEFDALTTIEEKALWKRVWHERRRERGESWTE